MPTALALPGTPWWAGLRSHLGGSRDCNEVTSCSGDFSSARQLHFGPVVLSSVQWKLPFPELSF